MRRLAAILILACSAMLAACSSLGTSALLGRDIAFTAPQLQSQLDRKFPRDYRKLGGLVSFSLLNPRLSLPGGGRLKLDFDLGIGAMGNASRNPSGHFALESGLRFDPGSRAIRHSSDPGRAARLAYTYLHLPIVAGIVVSAVGDELSLSHPHAPAQPAQIAVLLGGPALYLLGNALFKKTINQANLPLSHLAGLALLLALLWPAPSLSVLALSSMTTAVLLLVAMWETLSLRGLRRELYAGE